LKNNDFKAGAVQICVEFLAKIMVFFFKSSIFTTAWPAILFVPQHIPSLEFYAEDQADLGQMAPPTPFARPRCLVETFWFLVSASQ